MTEELKYVYNKTRELKSDVETARYVVTEFNNVTVGVDLIKRLDCIVETLEKVLEFVCEAEGLDEEDES